MSSAALALETDRSPQALLAAVQPYQQSDTRKAIGQIATSIPPFLLMWGLMYFSLSYSYALTLLLAMPTAGFLLRTFIVQHDCGHGSFFASSRANHAVGYLCGVLTLTPYHQWRHAHAVHHATTGRLDKRGVGDVDMLTVAEYRAASPLRKIWYRIYRHPMFMMFVGGPILFSVIHRFATAKRFGKERMGVYWTNLGIAVYAGALIYAVGLKPFLMVQLPITWMSAAVGTWIFYMQHQFNDAYWERGKKWDYAVAAFHGSSYYKLPKVLQWFSGNIGIHHVHHLSARIPNYELQRCHDELGLEGEPITFTLWGSRECLHVRLWDEEKKRMVGFEGV